MPSQVFVNTVSIRKRMFSLMLVALLGLALLASTPISPIEAASIQQTYNKSADQFSWAIVGGDFDSDDSHKPSKGTIWKLAANITEDAGTINDVLSINGTAQYSGVPYVFSFNFAIDSDDYEGGNYSKEKSVAYAYGDYKYDYNAELNFTTENTLNLDDITGYTLTVTGLRTKIIKVAVPTPELEKWIVPEWPKDFKWEYDPERLTPEKWGMGEGDCDKAPDCESAPEGPAPEPTPAPAPELEPTPTPKALPK